MYKTQAVQFWAYMHSLDAPFSALCCDETDKDFVRGSRADDETIDIKMGFKEISKIDV